MKRSPAARAAARRLRHGSTRVNTGPHGSTWVNTGGHLGQVYKVQPLPVKLAAFKVEQYRLSTLKSGHAEPVCEQYLLKRLDIVQLTER